MVLSVAIGAPSSEVVDVLIPEATVSIADVMHFGAPCSGVIEVAPAATFTAIASLSNPGRSELSPD